MKYVLTLSVALFGVVGASAVLTPRSRSKPCRPPGEVQPRTSPRTRRGCRAAIHCETRPPIEVP